ncbi:hypothetical protein [Pseudomonas syringae]|nr:hypothetical protein [Pseudomonas syringae]
MGFWCFLLMMVDFHDQQGGFFAMRMLIGAVVAFFLAGCATSQSDLERHGKVGLDGRIIKSLTVSAAGRASAGGLPRCVATIVRNDSVSLTTSGGFVGAYTGNYYPTSSSREVGGGSVIQYASQDGAEVVARGETRFMTAMVERSLRYTISAKDAGVGREYRFTAIQQAGTANGYGYNDIAAMAGTGAEAALAALHKITDELESCLR